MAIIIAPACLIQACIISPDQFRKLRLITIEDLVYDGKIMKILKGLSHWLCKHYAVFIDKRPSGSQLYC